LIDEWEQLGLLRLRTNSTADRKAHLMLCIKWHEFGYSISIY